MQRSVAPADVPPLHTCYWVRVFCPNCGILNVATDSPPQRECAPCPVCGLSCLASFKGTGRTIHDLPHVQPVGRPVHDIRLNALERRPLELL